ncbi:MAG: class I SAM-dependent methyltransferase [Nitrosospira sp.]
MGTESVLCEICGSGDGIETSRDITKVKPNVRQFQNEEFTVWRCANCGSLHSLEDIDYAHYYKDYAVHRQKMDFYSRKLFSSRMRQLIRGGLLPRHSILDFGCGNGNFVRFLREKGYAGTEGYDPFSHEFGDSSVITQQFDVVICQDVIEHAPNPGDLLDEIASLVRRPGGILAIGTPNAEYIQLKNPLDAVGQLHQPFHRHILTSEQLVRMLEHRKFHIGRIEPRSYVETKFPFVNSPFFFNYMASIDGTLDCCFDPIDLGMIFRSPKLLFYGFFGYFLNPKKDMSVIAIAN